MNTTRQTRTADQTPQAPQAHQARVARLTSVVMSVLMTLTILGGIDHLTQRDLAADSLMAKAAAKAAAPRG
jgi:hypothetical protein